MMGSVQIFSQKYRLRLRSAMELVGADEREEKSEQLRLSNSGYLPQGCGKNNMLTSGRLLRES
jgi:hypothetical protein